jgi:competence protein ComEA
VQRDAAPPPLIDSPQVRATPHLDLPPAANRPGGSVSAVATSSDSAMASPSAPANPVDINTASVPELKRLPGIGPVLAERIILYRVDHGPFRQVDDLQRVRGIGTKTLAAVRPLVAVQPPSSPAPE